MKARYFFPPAVFLIIAVGGSLFTMPPDPVAVIQFTVFLAGFAATYLIAVGQTLKNRRAVRDMKASSPYMVPVICFMTTTAASTAITMAFLPPRTPGMMVSFGYAFLMALASYAAGMFIVIRDIKKQPEPAPVRADAVAAKNTDRKLLLINPVNPEKTGLTHNLSSRFPPLSLGIIAALTPARFSVEIADENMAPFRYRNADLVGITAFTASAPRAYEIAALYRARGVPVVMGGIHASMRPEEALCYVDAVVTGEAEGVWPEVIRDYLDGALKKRYAGGTPELKGMPALRRDLFDPRYLFASVQTSRGCPMDCEFCSVTAFNGRTYRERPVEEVLEEISGIPQRQLFFVDDNIAGYSEASMKRAARLFQGMAERKLDKTWFCQASLNFGTDEELLHWARKAGCRMVFLGLESPDPVELKAMNKKVNLRVDYKKALRTINRHGIAVLGAFINGTPNETPRSLVHKADYILRHPIDVIQATIMTPLPGTRFFDALERENRLLYTDFPADWSRYTMGELTFALSGMGRDEFMELHDRCNRRFYSRFGLAARFLRTFVHTRSMESAIWAYNSNRNYRNVSFNRAAQPA